MYHRIDRQERSRQDDSFKAVLGLIRKDGGEITVFGKSVESLDVKDKEHMGVVLSDSGFERLSVSEGFDTGTGQHVSEVSEGLVSQKMFRVPDADG